MVFIDSGVVSDFSIRDVIMSLYIPHTGTLLRKFHRSGIFLVAYWYILVATYLGYGKGRGIDQKLTYFSVIERY
jgi:hypothetical protein